MWNQKKMESFFIIVKSNSPCEQTGKEGERMKTEVVWIAYDGHYATTILEHMTDVQGLDGTILFFNGDKLLMGVAVSKLVYFKTT